MHPTFMLVFMCAFTGWCLVVVGAQIEKMTDLRHCGFQQADDHISEKNKDRTSIDEFPWVAALIHKFKNSEKTAIFCSAAIINYRYVLTIAQCVVDIKLTTLEKVRVGEHDISKAEDCVKTKLGAYECSRYVDHGIEEKLHHPQYNTKTRENDIALIRLEQNIDYTSYARPICLPIQEIEPAEVNDILYNTGWGKVGFKSRAIEKKKIWSKLISNDECIKELNIAVVTENHICTKDLSNNTVFTNVGDIGSPVVFANGLQWHLEGIFSWGGAAGSEKPKVHTKVGNYLDWIQNNIKDY